MSVASIAITLALKGHVISPTIIALFLGLCIGTTHFRETPDNEPPAKEIIEAPINNK